MNGTMLKYLGLLLLAVGVGIAAAFGAREPAAAETKTRLDGAAQFRTAAETTALEKYCQVLKEERVELDPACPGAEPETETAQVAAADGEPLAFEARVRAARLELVAMRERETELSDRAEQLREAWLRAKEAAIEPRARAETTPKAAPGARLSAWFDQSGTAYLLGLMLVIAGAVVGRIGVRREAEVKAGAGAGEGIEAVDFGQLLSELRVETEALGEEMNAMAPPDSAVQERIKERIERLQEERQARLVDARGSVQLRYGIAGFAAIFGPLSGAERRLARAWSSLVDGYWSESAACVREAAALLLETEGELGRHANATSQR